MFARTVQMLVPARRASPFSTRQLHSLPRSSTYLGPFSKRHISSRKVNPQDNPPIAALSLWDQLREAKPAVRYTVYAGVGLMATAESTFWFNVIRAKYFPPVREEEKKKKADQFLRDFQAAVHGYKAVWLNNYQRYYGAYLWGLGYGGVDGIQSGAPKREQLCTRRR